MEVGGYSVSCLFRCIEDGFKWVFTGVYGPVESGERCRLWEELGDVAGRWDLPWCVEGNFSWVEGKMRFDGLVQEMVDFLFRLCIIFLLLRRMCSSLGRLFGFLVYLPRWPFLYGLLLWTGY